MCTFSPLCKIPAGADRSRQFPGKRRHGSRTNMQPRPPTDTPQRLWGRKHLLQDRGDIRLLRERRERRNSWKCDGIQGVHRAHRPWNVTLLNCNNVWDGTPPPPLPSPGLASVVVISVVCNLEIIPSVENEFPAEGRAERSSDNWPNYCK